MPVQTRKNIAIAAGGDSGEAVVSLNSAKVIKQYLNASRYNVYVIFINRHKWVYVAGNGREYAVDRNDFSVRIANRKTHFDCVFNAIHGTPGENGQLQGYFDLLGIPYTTCNQVTSALTFNKAFCNRVVAGMGALTSHSLHLRRGDKFMTERIMKELKLPAFVKPNNGGSSIGMSKVTEAAALPAALRKAFKEDDEILVEEFVKGREITCGVFCYKGRMLVFPVTEIISEKDFFDYEAKYLGKSQEITPAQITEDVEILCKSTSARLYRQLNCQGVVRFDYIMSKKGLYFLELNTVPGMSTASIVPQQARAFGLELGKFFTMIVEDALYRSRKRK